VKSNKAWALSAQVLPVHNDQVKDMDTELENTLSDTGDDDATIEEFSAGNNYNNETTGELAKANLTRQYHQRF